MYVLGLVLSIFRKVIHMLLDNFKPCLKNNSVSNSVTPDLNVLLADEYLI